MIPIGSLTEPFLIFLNINVRVLEFDRLMHGMLDGNEDDYLDAKLNAFLSKRRIWKKCWRLTNPDPGSWANTASRPSQGVRSYSFTLIA